MEISDNEIVKQVREGNVEAFSEIVLRYQKPVFNLMYRFSQSEHDATELTQDIFCKQHFSIWGPQKKSKMNFEN